MGQEQANTIIELLKELLSKPDGVVIASYITVGGMFGVAAITAIAQWMVTKAVIHSEHKKLQNQMQSEFRLQQFSSWQEEFLNTISNLLANTDPEVNPTPPREKVVPLIQKAQLLLNLELEPHRKVNALINELGLAVNHWQLRAPSEVLGIQGRLLEAAREAIYLPGR